MGELTAESPGSGDFSQKTAVSTRQPESTLTPSKDVLNDAEGAQQTPVSVSIGDLSEPNIEDLSDAPRPKVIWEKGADAKIVSGTLCCGYTSPLVPLNYIPAVQIWGDGHIIWVKNQDDGSRLVQEAWLSPEEMKTSLGAVVDAGFFGMQSKYKNALVTDLPEKCLVVNLAGNEKQVCEYYQGAPQEFHDLYGYFANGVGMDGKVYVPTSAYLVSYPFSLEANVTQDAVGFIWDSESLGLSLSGAVDQGLWVEGPPLELAWEIVNANPGFMVVQDGDRYYQISLQIPGISWEEPPAR